MDDAYRILDLKSLRCFWAVAKHRSLTRAGIELGISEPAVSQRVRALERYLGVKLYEARGGRVTLTGAGEHAFETAVGIFDRLEQLEREVVAQAATGTITFAAEEAMHAYVLPPVIERFRTAHPRVRLRLLDRSWPATVELLRRNEADVALLALGDLPPELVFHQWRTYPSYLLIPIGHPLLRRGRPKLADLLNEATVMRYPLITGEANEVGFRRLSEGMRKRGLPLNVAFEVSTSEMQKNYVAQGLGMAVVTGISVAGGHDPRMEAIEIPPEYDAATDYGVILRRDKYVSPALRGLLSLIGVPERLERPA